MDHGREALEAFFKSPEGGKLLQVPLQPSDPKPDESVLDELMRHGRGEAATLRKLRELASEGVLVKNMNELGPLLAHRD